MTMDTSAVSKVINLMAETGLFFAQADGKYDDREKSYIENFLNNLSAYGDVSEVKETVEGALAKKFTLDGIVADTKDLISGFNDTEKAAIVATLGGFIANLIKADGVEAKAETENFEAWKRALGVA